MLLLKRGDRGDSVRQVQEDLQRWGVTLPDQPGHFGLWTEAAIYLLQRGAGLAPDGVIGPQTAACLRNDTPPAAFSPAPELLTLLPVPYLSQRDNVHRPLSTCNVTALAMALGHFNITARSPDQQLEDELYELLHSEDAMAYYQAHSPKLHSQDIPPQEVFDNLTWATQRCGLPSSFAEDRTLSAIETEVSAGRPVLLSGTFTGSGHIVLLVGLCQSGDFIIHDPYGDWNQDYQTADGAARIYARERTLGVLKAPAQAEKWGLFFG